MPVPSPILLTCDIPSIVKNSPCFNNGFSTLDNQAALVYLLEQRRAALTSTPVFTPAQLRKAAQCFCTPADPVADGFDVSAALTGAIDANAPGAAALTASSLRAASWPYRNMTLQELRWIEIITRCALASL